MFKYIVGFVVLALLAACENQQTSSLENGATEHISAQQDAETSTIGAASLPKSLQKTKPVVSTYDAVIEEKEVHAKASEPVVILQEKSKKILQEKAKPQQKNVIQKEVVVKEETVVKEKPVVQKKAEILVAHKVTPPAEKKKVIAPLVQEKTPPRTAAEISVKPSLVSLGNAEQGKKMTKKCQACHTFDNGGRNKVGPNLFGVFGRKQGSKEGFKYGSYLSSVDGVWDENKLIAWIADSKGVAKAVGKKAKMPSQKVIGTKADDVIAYLKTLQ
ncbi:MAG: c-type cytochrome [Ghiorsea sp.]